MTDWTQNGTFQQEWTEYDEDGYGIARARDVTSDVQRMGRQNQKLIAQVKALQNDIADIKNRRYWEEVEMFTDKTTGMSAAVRTVYRWQAETMRLEFTPDMFGAASYTKNPPPKP